MITKTCVSEANVTNSSHTAIVSRISQQQSGNVRLSEPKFVTTVQGSPSGPDVVSISQPSFVRQSQPQTISISQPNVIRDDFGNSIDQNVQISSGFTSSQTNQQFGVPLPNAQVSKNVQFVENGQFIGNSHQQFGAPLPLSTSGSGSSGLVFFP